MDSVNSEILQGNMTGHVDINSWPITQKIYSITVSLQNGMEVFCCWQSKLLEAIGLPRNSGIPLPPATNEKCFGSMYKLKIFTNSTSGFCYALNGDF